MIVPKYWAEGRAQNRAANKQVTVRRFGWSDASQLDAQMNADTRANEALARILAGEKLHRRDHKVPYNGAEGLPIREEVLSIYGTAVITRNSYGAHCLNTPNVLFADVDLEEAAGGGLLFAFGGSFVFTAVLYLLVKASGVWPFGNATLLVALFVATSFACFSFANKVVELIRRRGSGGPEEAALGRVREFSARHPDWGLRVYRTPAGFRVLASHSTFAPSQIEVAEFFRSLGVDSVYRRMCLNQQCFRARLTAKPWRAGIAAHMRPRPGVWPIKAEQIPVRAAWVAEYELAASRFAACRFVETLGNQVVHPDVRPIIELHDSLSRAHRELPLA